MLDIGFMFQGTESTRQIYAIIRSIEPSILALPWIMSVVSSFLGQNTEIVPARSGHDDNGLFADLNDIQIHSNSSQSAEDAAMNKKTMDDAMRNEIVEYLLKGIRRSITAYSNTKGGQEEPEEESDGWVTRVFKAAFGSCFRKDDDEETEEYRRNLQSSIIAGTTSVLGRVNLVEKKAILRESRREVSSR